MGKKSKAPPAPDYTALAITQAGLDKAAAKDQTVANRPDQYTPYGSSTWSRNGDQWSQNIKMDPAEQRLLDQQRALQYQQQNIGGGMLNRANGALAQKVDYAGAPPITGFDQDKLARVNPQLANMGIGDNGSYDMSKLGEQGKYDPSGLPQMRGIDPSGLPQMRGIDMSGQQNLDSGFGAVQQVQDAMMGRLAPMRQQARDAEIQRLKNQGIPEDSDAFQRAVKRLDESDTDAQQQALLGAAGEYGNIFNRGLNKNSQNFSQQQALAGLSQSQRAQLFGEQQTLAGLSQSQRAQLFGEQGSMANLANANRGQQFGEQGSVASLRDFQRNNQFGQNAQVQQMLASLRGQQFGEQGAAAQLSGQQRQQYLAEQEAQRQSPINDYMKLVQGINPTNPQMPSFMGGTGYNAANVAGAGNQQYQAAMNSYNADQARSGGLMSGLFGLGSAALGGPLGGMAGKAIGGMFGGGP